MSQELNKARLINHLAEVHGYRHYLELCTLSTGRRYAEIDRSRLETCVRLMYRCPDDFDDGLPIDYRSSSLDIGECLKTISDEGRRFDIALVDSWHEYATSWRDLVEGFLLIREGGTLVVHDCLPPRSEIAVANYIPGEWCGVGYQAYVDFISQRRDLAVYTVDTDYGCGSSERRSISRERDICRSSAPRRLARQARRPHGSLRFLSGAQAGSAELDHDRGIFRE